MKPFSTYCEFCGVFAGARQDILYYKSTADEAPSMYDENSIGWNNQADTRFLVSFAACAACRAILANASWVQANEMATAFAVANRLEKSL